MRRILMGLVSIGAVSVMVFGVTRAYFTDQATNTGNKFVAGTLEVNLDGQDNSGTALNSPFFDVSGMIPDDDAIETAYVEVRNDGDADMLFRSYVEATNDPQIGDENFSDQLELKVTLNPSEYDTLPAEYFNYGPANTLMTDGTDGWISLKSLIGEDEALDNLDAAFVNNDPLESGYAAVYKVEMRLPFDTGNEWQGRNFQGNLVVDATQFEGQTDADNVVW